MSWFRGLFVLRCKARQLSDFCFLNSKNHISFTSYSSTSSCSSMSHSAFLLLFLVSFIIMPVCHLLFIPIASSLPSSLDTNLSALVSHSTVGLLSQFTALWTNYVTKHPPPDTIPQWSATKASSTLPPSQTITQVCSLTWTSPGTFHHHLSALCHCVPSHRVNGMPCYHIVL